MKASSCQIDITPAVGTELSGFVARQQPSVGVHDNLYLRGLRLRQGDERLLWLHCDLIGFDDRFAQEVRQAIAGRHGLEVRQIVLSATHNHCGPATLFLRQCGRMDEAYMRSLRQRIEGAADTLAANEEDATLCFAEGRCELAIDRRKPSPHSHTDPRLPVLVWRRPNGTPAAVLTNYAMHNTALGAVREISADAAGAAAGAAQRELSSAASGEPARCPSSGGPGDGAAAVAARRSPLSRTQAPVTGDSRQPSPNARPLADARGSDTPPLADARGSESARSVPPILFTNGACGNINPPTMAATFEQIDQWGRTLGAEVARAARAAAPCDDETLASRQEMVSLPLAIPTEAEVLAQFEATTQKLDDSPVARRVRAAMTQWRDDALAALRTGRPARELRTPLQVLRIGPARFVCVGAEVFSRLADDLRQRCGQHTYVVGYANGDLGYLPHRNIYAEGGYEVTDAYRYYGTFMVAAGAFESLRDRAAEMLATL